MIYMSRKAVDTAKERIVSFASLSGDDVAIALRKMIPLGDYLDQKEFQGSPDRNDTKCLVLPSEARTANGDRVCLLLVPDEYSKGETVAVVCKPLRSVRKDPTREKPTTYAPERMVSMPKLPTLEEISVVPPAPEPVALPPVATPANGHSNDYAAAVSEKRAALQERLDRAQDRPRKVPGEKRKTATKVASPGLSRGAALLRNEILKRGITVKDAAELFGISPWQVSRWQCGQQLPDLASAAKLERNPGIPMRAWSEQL